MPSLQETPPAIYSMIEQPAAQKLKEEAKSPIDLRKKGLLSPQRIERFQSQACGFKLLYATEKVSEETLSNLYQLAEEMGALKKMGDMQAGKTMNFIAGYPSENRPVLHTAVRDHFSQPNRAIEAQKAQAQAKNEIEKLKQFIDKIDKKNQFTDLLFVAIGGSELGPKAHYIALEAFKKAKRQVHFIGNIDPDSAAAALNSVDLSKTLVLIVSKSGTTMETCSNEAFLRSHFEKKGVDPKQHFIAITSKGSVMDDKSHYLEVFNLWDWVGGRFSTTSMVGGVMLSFAYGFDCYWELLRGASDMDKTALDPDLKKNLPLLSALLTIWNHNFLNTHSQALIPYSQALQRYSAHIQQVEMESNGKRIDQQGNTLHYRSCPVVWGEPGTNAQHSFFQLLHQGTEQVHLNFIGFLETTFAMDYNWEGSTQQQKLIANLLAQSLALAQGKQSDNPNKLFPGNTASNILFAKKLTPYQLGALLAFYEHKVAFQGFIWGINAFDQEGVQLGKELAVAFLDRIKERKAGHIEPRNEEEALQHAMLAIIEEKSKE